LTRYVYSLVRCVPEPRTGEFVNVGAVVGQPGTDDWAVRRVSSDRRALRLGTADQVGVAHAFLSQIEETIERSESLDPVLGGELQEAWLATLARDHRNVVQLTSPAPIVAEDAESALDTLFSHLLIDPISRPRGYVTKNRVIATVRESYRHAHVRPDWLQFGAEIVVGSLRAPIDVAVANGSVHQLTQAWSFQRESVSEVSTQVKAWGYAISRLVEHGERARLETRATASPIDVPRTVDIQIAVAQPRSDEQESAYEEARQVFAELHASVHTLEGIEQIGTRAAELIGKDHLGVLHHH
jgi:Protein of unknown function (DUF3037)